MKNLRGYLVAAIFAVISGALIAFAKAHSVLVDMIYPYMTRLVISTLADMNAGGGVVWQWLLVVLVLLGIATVAMMIFFKWNPIRCVGWMLAVISLISMLNTALYGLNAYTSPLADDMRLEVTNYTVSELYEATVYFRDKANELATQVSRDGKGNVDFGTFEQMAEQAGEGFRNLTYQEALSVYAGSTVPVKKQFLFCTRGDSGITVALTGEACVNPNVPTVSMPFAMCKEMAHRMTIYSDADANFSAFLAASHNSSVDFQYSAYLMAYYYCYHALVNIPTSTAQACAEQNAAGENQLVKNDLADCAKFYDYSKESRSQDHNITDEGQDDPQEETSVVTFSSYSSSTDLFASWYIQNFILPEHRQEEAPFDPYDPTQVDITGIVNAPTAG